MNEAKHTTIHVGISFQGFGRAKWTCQCGQTGNATEGVHFGPRGRHGNQLTALQRVEHDVIEHRNQAHQMAAIEWVFPDKKEDTTT